MYIYIHILYNIVYIFYVYCYDYIQYCIFPLQKVLSINNTTIIYDLENNLII